MAEHIPFPHEMTLTGDLESKWRDFKEEWEDYFVATGLSNKDKTVQVATLKRAMGLQCKKRLNNLNLSDEESKEPETVLAKLTEYFTPKRNVLYDRHIFFEATQQQNETVDQYIFRLTQLAAPCKFGNAEEDMVVTRHVLGCKDRQAKARLFRESTVTLQIARDRLQISESTSEQMRIVDGGGERHVNFADMAASQKQSIMTKQKARSKRIADTRRKKAAAQMHVSSVADTILKEEINAQHMVNIVEIATD